MVALRVGPWGHCDRPGDHWLMWSTTTSRHGSMATLRRAVASGHSVSSKPLNLATIGTWSLGESIVKSSAWHVSSLSFRVRALV
jgi:hypothetical protein